MKCSNDHLWSDDSSIREPGLEVKSFIEALGGNQGDVGHVFPKVIKELQMDQLKLEGLLEIWACMPI